VGKEGYPPMMEMVCDVLSACPFGIGPSGSASSAFESGKDDDEEPTGLEGLMT
jgi:hypothetical protein